MEKSNTFLLAEGSLDNPQEVLNKLGGSLKIFLLNEIGKVEMTEMRNIFYDRVFEDLKDSDKKHNWGLSLFDMPKKELKTLLVGVKKYLNENGVKNRFVNKNFKDLSTAATVKEDLLGEGNAEFGVFEIKSNFFIGRCVAVQDIDDYSKRDYDRPGRSAKAGMLPPKLAQIMLNLAGLKKGQTVYDPFCGSGTILTEGMLMAFDVIGSDVSADQVSDSQKNIEWMKDEYFIKNKAEVFVKDATLPCSDISFDAIVTEGYLGTPLSKPLKKNEVNQFFAPMISIYMKFFDQIKDKLKKGQRVVISLPYSKTEGGGDEFLSKYIKIDLQNVIEKSLLYRRKDQVVGREIFVLEK